MAQSHLRPTAAPFSRRGRSPPASSSASRVAQRHRPRPGRCRREAPSRTPSCASAPTTRSPSSASTSSSARAPTPASRPSSPTSSTPTGRRCGSIAAPADVEALRQHASVGAAGHRRLDRHGELLGPAAQGRRRGPRAAGRRRGRGLAGRCRRDHRRQGRAAAMPPAKRTLRRACRSARRRAARRPSRSRRIRRTGATSASACAKVDTVRQDQRHGAVHPRREAAGHADVRRRPPDAASAARRKSFDAAAAHGGAGRHRGRRRSRRASRSCAEAIWPAKKGRDALKIEWDESGAEKRGTDELIAEYTQLAPTHGADRAQRRRCRRRR